MFVKNKLGKCGLRANCKECDKVRKMKHYQENKEKFIQAYQEFMVRNPEYFQPYERNINKQVY